MFDYLSGTVAHLAMNYAVIDCGGVGYACHTSSHTIAGLRVKEQGKLYTHLYLREDACVLYGFASEGERSCFLMLLSVSGVGPKAALSILSSVTPEQLASCIILGDDKALTGAPGIGKKIAQRIILELKDKLAKGQLPTGGEAYGGSGVTVIPENKASEAAAALAVLGYGPGEIAAALKGIEMESLGLDEIVRQALKKMI